MRATICSVCAEGRAAMDAGNEIGPEGAASLAPALKKMTQLTSLDLGCARILFRRGLGTSDGRCCGAVVGVRICGSAMLATVFEVCAEGRAAMDAGNRMGPEGAASLAPALEEMTQLSSLNLRCARIRFWARPWAALGVFVSLVRAVAVCAWMRCAVGVRA